MRGKRRQTLWAELEQELLEAGGAGGVRLDEVFSDLEDFPSPAPPEEGVGETARLLAGAVVPGAFRRQLMRGGFDRAWGAWPTILAIRSQVSVFSLGFWLAAALVTLVAAVTTLNIQVVTTDAGAPTALAFPLAVASPVVAALGVSYALRSFGRGPWEVELSCPITPSMMALGRLAIVLAYVTVLALGASLALWVSSGASAVPGALRLVIASWLAPVFFLSSLSFYVSLRASPLLGTAAALAVWGVQVAISPWRPEWSLLAPPGTLPWTRAVLMAIMAVVLVGASLLAAREAAERSGGAAA